MCDRQGIDWTLFRQRGAPCRLPMLGGRGGCSFFLAGRMHTDRECGCDGGAARTYAVVPVFWKPGTCCL